MRLVIACSALLLVLLAACGGSSLGDSCDKEGEIGDSCDDGLICGKNKPSMDLVCLKRCTETNECPSTQECSGLSGSLKACQNK